MHLYGTHVHLHFGYMNIVLALRYKLFVKIYYLLLVLERTKNNGAYVI